MVGFLLCLIRENERHVRIVFTNKDLNIIGVTNVRSALSDILSAGIHIHNTYRNTRKYSTHLCLHIKIEPYF